MGLDYYLSLGVCLIFPIAFAIWWIQMRLGLDKRWFVMPAAPFISRNFYFALPTVTIGLTTLIAGVTLFSFNPDADLIDFLLITTWVLWGISFIFAYLEPDWMSPTWYRWLKKEHGDILPYLAVEAHQLGRKEWLARVKTQKGLEQWVAEVRSKYKR